ncbi:ethanolamine utilization protein [Streptococcus australis]|uniref:ethanolamine utilization protein n=1 Tax=Streptococcus australis TaxID=113107 RepID=UPI0039C4D23E
MENLDKIVDLITDRLMDKLQVESYKSSVFVIGAFDTPDILEREGYQVVKNSSSADIILVESIGFDAMLRIASLCPLTADEAVVIKSLLKGKKVLVLNESFDFHQYKQTSKALLFQDLQEQYEKLIRYGVQFYKKEELVSILEESTGGENNKPVQDVIKNSSTPKTVEKVGLLTEKKLIEMNLSDNDSIRLKKGMIVTALAKDYLKRHNINIEE